ncbi:DJ-1/PfpI family protein [Sphingobium yanoikuyae]|uniref:DJ-1/PfpI family protein n=1 Tax=Sphingobium yanoikuyae TaxID=13690 RepID=UPI0022DD9668|nr:DJ-1/PfpI family protein [Sphingobium yanoikuyae]WBQ17595.1 DJ-1/PfpI family protein [Sphingobium yanoikuyae]
MTQSASEPILKLNGPPATVGILLFPEVEVLDFAGPYEVFSVAARIAPKALALEHSPFNVVTVAEHHEPVVARHGLQVFPTHDFDDAPALDVLIVPGGVVDQPLKSEKTLDWLRGRARDAKLTASVCTGAFVLAKIGLLDGLMATTHWEDVAEMRCMFPNVNVIEDVHYVDQGQIVTSAGISAGINMSLHLVQRLAGPHLASLTSRQMQYDWQDVPSVGWGKT